MAALAERLQIIFWSAVLRYVVQVCDRKNDPDDVQGAAAAALPVLALPFGGAANHGFGVSGNVSK